MKRFLLYFLFFTMYLQHGYSQEALALIAGVDRSYVGRVERGDNNIAILTLLKLSQALELSLEQLMRDASL